MVEDKIKIKFLDDCLLIKDILVIGDLHFGRNEQFHESVFPGLQLKEILEKLDGIFDYLETEKIKVKKIILLGDVKHDFGTITDIEWRETLEFFDFLKKKLEDVNKISNKIIKDGVSNMDLANNQTPAKIGKDYDKTNKDKLKNKIIVIKGNHDNILKPIVKKSGIKLVDYHCVEIKEGKKNKKICFLHGNKLFKQCSNSDYLIFGHLHPAITVYDKYKSEKYKCFLKGKWDNKEVYILPNFSLFNLGYDLRNIDNINEGGGIGLLSWFSKLKGKSNNIKRGKNKLKDNSRSKEEFFVIPNNTLKNFEVVIYNNKWKKEYNFGVLKRLLKRLLKKYG